MEDDQEILEEFIDQVFKDSNAYKLNFKTILEGIKKNNDEFLRTALDCIKLILSSYEPGNPFDEVKQKHSPETHLQALRAIKDLMEIKSEHINFLISEMILPYFKKIALFTKEKNDQKFKKESYFGNKDKFANFSSSFVILTLESLKMWSSWYPNSDFSAEYKDLIRKNVTFPKNFIYYKEEDYIENNMKNMSMIDDFKVQLPFEIEAELQLFEQEKDILKRELTKNDVSLMSKQIENSKLKISEIKIKMTNFKDQLAKSRDMESQAKYASTLSKELELADTILTLKEFYSKNEINPNEFMDSLFEIFNLNNPNLAASKTNKPVSNIFPSRVENEIFNDVLQDVANYGKNRKEYIKKLSEVETEKVEELLSFIKSILVADSYSPINKVLALRFLKECVDTKSAFIISYVENNILDLLFSVSAYKIEDTTNEKGKSFFSSNAHEKNEELEKLSLTYYLQALECVLIWARWFPHERRNPKNKSKFLQIYEELAKMGCIFPKTLKFFSDDDFTFEMLVRNMEDLFDKLKNLLPPNENQVIKKNLLQLMKDINIFLNLKKNEQFFTKIGSMQEPSKIQMLQKLDHDFSILKMAIVSYDKMNRKEIKYEDFRHSIIKELDSPLSLLAVGGKLELINLEQEDEIFEEPFSQEHQEIPSIPIQLSERNVMNPELEEKMLLFIRNVLMKQEQYERNAFSYLMNFDLKKEEVLHGLDLVLDSHEYSFIQKFFALLFLKQIMDERIYFFELDKIFSEKILDCFLLAQKLAKEINPPPFAVEFIDLANECFLVWNYWAEQDYKENKEKLVITKILSSHFLNGIKTEKGNEFIYFDNNENQFNSYFCLFFKDSEMYLDVLTNYLQKFDDFINSIKEYQSNWEIEHRLKNFFLGFEDITNHHTDLSDSDPKIVKCLDIFVHESQTYQDYQEKKISFHELIEILKGNLNNHEESPEISEFKRELESPQKFEVQEENELDNEKVIKNSIVSSQYRNSQEVFKSKVSNPYSSHLDDMDENLEYSPVKNVNQPNLSSKFQIIPPPLNEKLHTLDSESPKHNESLKLIDSLTIQNRNLEHQLRDEKNKVDSMREENTSLLREMNKFQIELKEEKRNNNLLNDLLTQADTNKNASKRDCEKYIKDIINLREEIENKNIENEKLKNENIFLKNLIEENERNFNSERENLVKATPIASKEEYEFPSNIEKILESTAKKEPVEKIFEPIEDHNFYNDEDDDEDNTNNGGFLENEKEISPLDRQMLFPFKSPIDYFTNKNTKEYKGKLTIYNRALFKNVFNLRIDTHRFKTSCLKKRSVLLKNDHLQIGIVTNNQISKDKHFLRLNIFFTNKSEFRVTDLDFEFLENETLTVYCKNDNFQNVLQPGMQTKIEIIIENNNLPFEMLLVEIKYKAEGSFKSTKIPLPSTFNLFMRWGELTPPQFKSKWKEITHQKNFKLCKTKIVPLNKKIVKSINDIKEFFPFLIDLKPTLQNDFLTKISSYSLGGLFCFSDVEQEFLIKLTLNPDDSFIIRVISLKENESQMKMKEFLLQNFLFLLEENED